MDRIALTGIKPTGPPHVGNYLGMIKPALELAQEHQALYFLADYHALTTVKNRDRLIQLTYEVVAAWIALGLDPDKVIFYRQSDIIEVFELTWILDCFAAKGLLNRAHAYKAVVDENLKAGRDPDKQINMGLFNYPVLMAADILLYGSHIVPVGLDQKQHLEMARDIAIAFNKNYGNILVLPEASIKEEVMTIPGTDGRKMSASFNNTLPVFAPPKELRQRVMRIVTDSKRPEDSKDPESCNVFAIYRHFAAPDAVESTRQRYIQGGLAYGELKGELFDLLESTFGSAREKYQELLADRGEIDRILMKGGEEARTIAMPIMERVRQAVGVAK